MTSSLQAAVPANVREVCAKLVAAGHEAVTVGGAVRDALLGVDPGDWDVATSARPDDVLKLFRHTIPTGLQHGTVTIVTGRGVESHVEVTTYRGEGAYSDARRPDTVTFGVPLVEDLARRDLTVNAIAYDPLKDELIDPFHGREDLDARRLRAVGDAVARFTEDGLRVMRAVRFAARLEFELEAATEAAIPAALPSLAKVSKERVADELRKLLSARQPSRGLAIARRTGIVKTVLPELDGKIADEQAWLARVDTVRAEVRLAALLVPLDDAGVAETVCRGLKLSNAEIEHASQLVGAWAATQRQGLTKPDVRRLLADLDKGQRTAAAELWSAGAPELGKLAREILAAKDPLATGDLAVTGKDVMTALAMTPGPAVGRILALLLAYVLDDPACNTRELLLVRAQQLELEVGR
jgi:tRNA nucleotidyltransferase (CCA-adding enzyme)